MEKWRISAKEDHSCSRKREQEEKKTTPAPKDKMKRAKVERVVKKEIKKEEKDDTNSK